MVRHSGRVLLSRITGANHNAAALPGPAGLADGQANLADLTGMHEG